MTFPVDQLTPFPSAPGTQPWPNDDGKRTNGYNDSAGASQDAQDLRRDNFRDANLDHSDFQRHLDDAAGETMKTSNAMSDDHIDYGPRSDVEPGDGDDESALRGDRDMTTHGQAVSEVAREASPRSEPVPAVTPVETAQANEPGAKAPTEVKNPAFPQGIVAADGMTVSVTAAMIRSAAQNKEPASFKSDLPGTSSLKAGTAIKPADASSVSKDGVPETPAPAKAETSEPGTQSAPSEAPGSSVPEGEPAAETQQGATPKTTEPETSHDPSSVASPMFNENAQKTDTAERPGWGAQNAPRSAQGEQARQLKSDNAQSASGTATTEGTTDALLKQASAGPNTEGTRENPEAVQSEDGSGLGEVLSPDHGPKIDEAKPQGLAFGLAAMQGAPLADKQQGARVAAAAKSTVKAAGGSDGDKVPASITPAATGKNLAATPQVPAGEANSATAGSSGAQVPGAIPAPSPMAAARAQVSGQSAAPMTTTPSAEQVGQALTGGPRVGTDKRGSLRDAEPGSIASEATGKSKTGSSVSFAASQKAGAGAQSPSAQGQAPQAAQVQTPQPGQAPMAPTMPDPSVLAGGMDMTMSRGGSTMEVDPVTGALHMSGTGSAKMAGPNISEVTMHFGRARMLQTPTKDIAVQIAKHLSNGVNRFNIRISPPEMGRIEIRMEITESGKVSAHLVADKPETLELLQKDRAALEKAMADAGLDTDADSLAFSMREGKDDKDGDFKNYGLEVADDASDGKNTAALEIPVELEVSAYGFDIVRMKRLDISI